MQLFDRTLGQWLEHWAEETPDKEYIVYSDRNLRFTWSQETFHGFSLARKPKTFPVICSMGTCHTLTLRTAGSE